MALSTEIKKKELIVALEKSLGIVTQACAKVGIDRSTYYDWIKNDEEFAQRVEDIKEIAIDFAESSLFEQIKEKTPSSTMFYLKTKAKHRGYIERVDNYNLNLNVGNKELRELDDAELDNEIRKLESGIGSKET